MAEYYPLLAKAVGSLPNSTPDTRRVVYERARKALIGQLRTLHPPVPDADIEHESTELDRAIARVEAELAPATRSDPDTKTTELLSKPADTIAPPAAPPLFPPAKPASTQIPADKPFPPLRTKLPALKPAGPAPLATLDPVPGPPDAIPPDDVVEPRPPITPRMPVANASGGAKQAKVEGQRPIAPQPPVPAGPKRRLWVIPAGVGLVVLIVAVAAWKLRDRPETIARAKPAEQSQSESGKIAERVGGTADPAPSDANASDGSTPATASAARPTPRVAQAPAQPTASPGNPELPVAHRAAMLVEAPSEENKVKTFLGTVVWKLNTVNEGQADAASLAVEADIDLPDDKMKAIVTFQKNTDASLPASHTIKVRFMIQPGSVTGDVKQINVPQMRREDSPSGDALAGVTVPIVQNSFLVGLSPGNAETANLEMLRGLQWIDIPMLLDSGKIAKLTFEKSDSGQRDLAEAIAAWQK